jgi:PAS domain S-box-containing protein
MKDTTRDQLLAENEELRRRVAALESMEADRGRAEIVDGKVIAATLISRDITDRKQAEEKLRKSEKMFRSLFQDSSVGTAVVSLDSALLQVNRAFCEFMGYSEEELVGKSVLSITHPDDQEESSKAIDQIAQSGFCIRRLEKRYLHKSGRVLWGEISSTLLRDAEGKPSYSIAQVLDIGERKRAEEALKKAHDELERRVEERTMELRKANEALEIFRRFAEASGQGFGMADMDGVITYMNPAVCHMAGVAKSEDGIGKHLAACYPEGYMRRRETEILPALLQNGHWEGELVFSSAGRTTYALQNSFLIKDENGNPSRLASVTTDITERKQAEEALRQSHDELRAIYESLREGLLVADQETLRLMRANAAVCSMLGYAEEELLSMSIADLHPKEALTAILEMLRKENVGHLPDKNGVAMRRKDGNVFYVDITGDTFTYQGRPCCLGVFRDVTERRQSQAALERERRTLEHMLRASDHERQLIAYDIHDGLAQYLTGAIMHLQMSEHLREQSTHESAKAFDGGMSLLRQAHLEARRLISGVRPPILDESGVVAAIAHLVHDPAFAAGPKIDFRSRVTFSRLNPVVENVIYRIVQEGLTNARNHSKSNRIVVSLVQRGERLRIAVRDWGIGFDPKTVQENRFGLDGIRERARLLGGKCNIKSEPGEGTFIVVELPVAEQRQEP